MPLVSTGLPNLLNGVSQQPSTLRQTTQGESQVNGFSSIIDGLIKRQPTEHVAKIINSAVSGAAVHVVNRDESNQYIIVVTATSSSATIQAFDLAGNSATSADLQGCFTSTYSVYRIIGVVGGAHGSEANVYFTLYTSTNTTVDGNWYGAGRSLDDAQAEANVAIAANDIMIINTRQSSTGFGLLDMHLYMQPSATVISGNTSLHDQGGDRGFYIFNAKNAGSTAPTGFKISSCESGKMSASTLSVSGYIIIQTATTKMSGRYS